MMSLKILVLRCLVVVLALVVQITPALAQQENGIAVIATPLSLNGRTIYQYRVVNNGPQRIVALIIGNDYQYGVPELTVYPDGWTADLGIKAGSVLSPPRWSPIVVATEERAEVELEWRSDDGPADVFPGRSLAGFAVVVPGQSTQYLTSHWTAILGNATAAYGVITQAGQPRLTLTLDGLTLVSPGRFNAQINVTNTGATAAMDVSITKLIPKSLSGTGTVTLTDTILPLQIGTIAAGAKATVNVVLSLSGSVKRISLTQQGVLKDSNGTPLNFSAAVSAYTKQ